MRIDFNKPYGVVQGGTNGEAFEQNGMMFDADGIAIGAEVVQEKKPRGRPKAADTHSVEDQLAAQTEQ